MYDHYFSNSDRPPILDDLCKDSATRNPWFCRRFLKIFIIYGHGVHLRQQTTTILAIFHSPNLRRLHMKFEQKRLRGSEKSFENVNERMDAQMKSDHYSSS